MKPLFRIAPLLLLLPSWASAGDPDFSAIVSRIESDLGIERMHIPLFGLATFFVRVAHPVGVKQLQMAIFDELLYTPPDHERFEQIVQRAVGDRWRPMVRVRSRDREWTYIYVRPQGRDYRMIIATFESNEAVVIELKANPDKLLASLDEPRHAGRNLSGESNK
jgi:hypothetical protein